MSPVIVVALMSLVMCCAAGTAFAQGSRKQGFSISAACWTGVVILAGLTCVLSMPAECDHRPDELSCMERQDRAMAEFQRRARR